MKIVNIIEKKLVLDIFFKVEEAQVQYELHSGGLSKPLSRLSLNRGNSVAVLVFNKDTQKIILINQFRYPTYQNGHGWVTETIAGMVDPGENAEESARRELLEESGLVVSTLEHISTFYPSPGGCSELIYLFYAEVSGIYAKYNKAGGLISEGEDILTLEMTLEEALEKIKSGELMDAKTIMGIMWLENRRLKNLK